MLYGLRPAGYRLTNVLIHFGTAAGVFLLSLALLDSTAAALAASLLFLLSHVATQPLYGSVANRTDSLAGLFGILSVYLFVRFRTQPRFRTCACLIVCLGLALLSKESALTVPLTFVLHDVLFPEFRGTKPWRVHLVPIGLMLCYLGLRIVLLGSVGSAGEAGQPVLWETVTANLRGALTTLFMPAIPPFAVRRRWLLLLLAAILLSAVQTGHRRPLRVRAATFLLLGYAILSAPVLYVIPGNISARFAYLSSALLLILPAHLTVEAFRAARQMRTPLLRIAVVFPCATLCLCSLWYGLRSFAPAHRRGTAASQLAEKLITQAGEIASTLNRGDRLLASALPAALDSSAVFYNGFCDALSLRYPRAPHCYVLSETLLEEPGDARSVNIRLSPDHEMELRAPPDSQVSFVLSQTEIERLRVGESLKSKFHRVTVLERSRRADGPERVVGIRIQLDSRLLAPPGRNHLLHFDGERFKLLSLPVPDS